MKLLFNIHTDLQPEPLKHIVDFPDDITPEQAADRFVTNIRDTHLLFLPMEKVKEGEVLTTGIVLASARIGMLMWTLVKENEQ